MLARRYACDGKIWPPQCGNNSSLSDIMIDANIYIGERYLFEDNNEEIRKKKAFRSLKERMASVCFIKDI